jgi:hypothetical protein
VLRERHAGRIAPRSDPEDNLGEDVGTAMSRLSIAWNGEIVGWMVEPRYDFPHYYGRWVGADAPVSRAFLAELRRAIEREDGLDVTLGETTRGVVYVHPDDEAGEIDVRLR